MPSCDDSYLKTMSDPLPLPIACFKALNNQFISYINCSLVMQFNEWLIYCVIIPFPRAFLCPLSTWASICFVRCRFCWSFFSFMLIRPPEQGISTLLSKQYLQIKRGLLPPMFRVLVIFSTETMSSLPKQIAQMSSVTIHPPLDPAVGL